MLTELEVRYEREADVRSYPTVNEELLMKQRVNLKGAGHCCITRPLAP